MTRWPPATSVSLLAVATILPRSSAARIALRLTTTGRGHDEEVHVVARGDVVRARRCRRRARAVVRGLNRATCSSNVVSSLPAASATTSEAIGWLAEHIERLASDRAGAAQDRDARGRTTEAASARAASRSSAAVHRRRGEQERVHAVEEAAVARNERARVLGARGALEHRFGRGRRLSEDRDHEAESARRRSASGPAANSRSPTTTAAMAPPITPLQVLLGEMWLRKWPRWSTCPRRRRPCRASRPSAAGRGEIAGRCRSG